MARRKEASIKKHNLKALTLATASKLDAVQIKRVKIRLANFGQSTSYVPLTLENFVQMRGNFKSLDTVLRRGCLA